MKRAICKECGKDKFTRFGICATCKPIHEAKLKKARTERQRQYQQEYYEKITKPKREKELLGL